MNTQHLQVNSLNAMTHLIPSKWTFLFCFAALLCFSPQYTYAQCTIHTRDGGLVNSTTSNDHFGQTFLPCADGEITSISVTANEIAEQAFAGTYELYIAVEPGNSIAIPAIPVASRTFISAPGDLEVITFTLVTSFPVSSGTTYRFVVDNTSGNTRIRFTNNDYADGNLITHANGYATSNNLDFEINMTSAAPTSAGIPTLSEWGLIILALSFMTMGTLYLVQPKFGSKFGFEQEG